MKGRKKKKEPHPFASEAERNFLCLPFKEKKITFQCSPGNTEIGLQNSAVLNFKFAKKESYRKKQRMSSGRSLVIYELSPSSSSDSPMSSGTICAIIVGILIVIAFIATLGMYVRNYLKEKLREEQYQGSPLSTPRSTATPRKDFETSSEMSPIMRH